MKTIEEQIMEARDDLTFAQATIADATEGVIGLSRDGSMAAYGRIVDRAASRLATLEAVRDGRMVEAWATVYCNRTGEWAAHGAFDVEPNSGEPYRVRCDNEYGPNGEVIRGIPRSALFRLVEVVATDAPHLDGGARSLDASEALREARVRGMREGARIVRENEGTGPVSWGDADDALTAAIEAVRKGER